MTVLMLDPVLQIAMRAALSLLLLWAASHKLRDVRGFRSVVANYDLLPSRWLGPFAVLLIAVEIGVAIGLWMPRRGVAAALTAAGLFALYAGAIVVNLRRGRRDIDCGCAGVAGRQPLTAALVMRNILLVVTALVSGLPSGSRPLTWMDTVTIAASVATLALLYAAVNGLLAQAPHSATLVRHRAADHPLEATGHGVAHA